MDLRVLRSFLHTLPETASPPPPPANILASWNAPFDSPSSTSLVPVNPSLRVNTFKLEGISFITLASPFHNSINSDFTQGAGGAVSGWRLGGWQPAPGSSRRTQKTLTTLADWSISNANLFCSLSPDLLLPFLLSTSTTSSSAFELSSVYAIVVHIVIATWIPFATQIPGNVWCLVSDGRGWNCIARSIKTQFNFALQLSSNFHFRNYFPIIRSFHRSLLQRLLWWLSWPSTLSFPRAALSPLRLLKS